MIVADYLDYDTAEVWDQGKSITCTAHAFFTLLAEHIQQDTGKEVEFDFKKHFAYMERYREAAKIVRGDKTIKKRRVEALCILAESIGFLTKTGERVAIKKYRRCPFYKNFNFLCKTLQNTGPLVFAVHTYSGHKLNPRSTDIIDPVKAGAKKKKMGHAMMIRGFDRQSQLLKFQNSWGKEDSIKYMPFDVYKDIVKYAYIIEGVHIVDKPQTK